MRRLAVALLLPLAYAGCGGIEVPEGERSLNRRQIAPGPGLFTGPSGTWTILRRDLPGSGQSTGAGDQTSEGT